MSGLATLRRRGMRLAAMAISVPFGALALGVIGCGDSYKFETTTGLGGTATTANATGGGSFPPFLGLVETAKDSTAFRGIRLVRSVFGNEVLETRQDVGADGTGKFAIELLETLSLPSDLDPLTFPIVFENSLRFQWQVRDFRLRGFDRAALSYSIRILPQTPIVATIRCARIEFYRNNPIDRRPGHYVVDVDPATGFVLAWKELDMIGQPIVESVYESFTYGGDVSDLSLRGRTFSAQPLDLAANLGQQAGFDVFYPDSVPDGFEVISGELMDVPSSIVVSGNAILKPGTWVRFLATDGIETVTFAHNDVQSPAAMGPAEIMMIRLGTWEVGFGEMLGTSYVIAGRLKDNDLRLIVQSAF